MSLSAYPLDVIVISAYLRGMRVFCAADVAGSSGSALVPFGPIGRRLET
jgi:hypothetical protein